MYFGSRGVHAVESGTGKLRESQFCEHGLWVSESSEGQREHRVVRYLPQPEEGDLNLRKAYAQMRSLLFSLYYSLKPGVPKRLLIFLRRLNARWIRKSQGSVWPISESARLAPHGWKGWPGNKQFALVLTHDVEKREGGNRCFQLAELEMEMGFRSSFNFVLADYPIDVALRHHLVRHGFEVGVHGVTHKGNMFRSKKLFLDQAITINKCLKEWGAAGFRAPSVYHNTNWISHLDVLYDASTFDTDPFQPQPDGVDTIFPFWVSGNSSKRGYVELPYTLPQDYTIFVLLEEKNISLWEHKLQWIVKNGGMALLITHPDYMNFGDGKKDLDEYPVGYYREFLEHVKSNYSGQYWQPIPMEVAKYWRANFSGLMKKDNTGVSIPQ